MLRGVHVSPEHQRRGIGTRLLRAFVGDLRAAECYCIPFAHLVGFYSQAGFSPVEESQAQTSCASASSAIAQKGTSCS